MVKPILEKMKNEIKVLGSYVRETDDVCVNRQEYSHEI